MRHAENGEERRNFAIEAACDETFGKRLALEIDRQMMEARRGRDPEFRNPRAFPGLTRGVVDLKDLDRRDPFRSSIGERIEAGAKYNVLGDATPESAFEFVLGIAISYGTDRAHARRVE